MKLTAAAVTAAVTNHCSVEFSIGLFILLYSILIDDTGACMLYYLLESIRPITTVEPPTAVLHMLDAESSVCVGLLAEVSANKLKVNGLNVENFLRETKTLQLPLV